jgi:hypothetical protein
MPNTGLPADLYITPVLLLCATCKKPIKATITTAQWIRVQDWISNEGECQRCYQQRKEQEHGQDRARTLQTTGK